MNLQSKHCRVIGIGATHHRARCKLHPEAPRLPCAIDCTQQCTSPSSHPQPALSLIENQVYRYLTKAPKVLKRTAESLVGTLVYVFLRRATTSDTAAYNRARSLLRVEPKILLAKLGWSLRYFSRSSGSDLRDLQPGDGSSGTGSQTLLPLGSSQIASTEG